jgi:hypothetical protein
MGFVRHVFGGLPFDLASWGRASKKALSVYSTSAAVFPISTLPLIAGFASQLIQTMSPLSCSLTGYLLAMKYMSDLFALP